LIDAYNEDVAAVYKTIRQELKAYKTDLSKRPEIIALTKVEGLDEEIIEDLANQLKRVAPKNSQIFAISSQSGFGLRPMLYSIKDIVAAERAKEIEKIEDNSLPVIRMTDTSDAFAVTKDEDVFVVKGERIEKFARRTDFTKEEGVQRLRDIMRRWGIMHELTRAGIEPGQTIRIGKSEFTY
jgi:GTP-binding protein